MDDCHPFFLFGNGTLVNDPNVSQANCDEQTRHAFRVRGMTFVQVKNLAFLTQKEGFDAEPFGIAVTSFSGQIHIGNQIDGFLIASVPPNRNQDGSIICLSETNDTAFHFALPIWCGLGHSSHLALPITDNATYHARQGIHMLGWAACESFGINWHQRLSVLLDFVG